MFSIAWLSCQMQHGRKHQAKWCHIEQCHDFDTAGKLCRGDWVMQDLILGSCLCHWIHGMVPEMSSIKKLLKSCPSQFPIASRAQVSISIHFPTCFPFRTFRNNLTFSIIFSDFISLPMVHRIPIGGWPRCCPGMNRSFRTSKVCWSPRTLRSKTQAALALALARVGMVRKCAQKIEGSYG